MRGDVQLISMEGDVLLEGRWDEWLHVQQSGTAVTLTVDLGDELLVSRLDPSEPRTMMVSSIVATHLG